MSLADIVILILAAAAVVLLIVVKVRNCTKKTAVAVAVTAVRAVAAVKTEIVRNAQ